MPLKISRVALVTGGMGGLGEAICIKLAALGYKVVTTHSPGNTRAKEWLDGMNKMGYGFRAFQCDVADWDSCVACAAAVTKEVGPIDVLVNNAGITRDMLAMRLKDEDWDAVLDTNLKAVFRMSRAVIRPMMKQRYGRIISITSVVGASGNPGQANYAAAKAGVAGMTRALARELGSRGITVNCVAPGFIETDMTAKLSQEVRDRMMAAVPLKRFGQPEDVANAVNFLASDDAAYITGHVININGGMYM